MLIDFVSILYIVYMYFFSDQGKPSEKYFFYFSALEMLAESSTSGSSDSLNSSQSSQQMASMSSSSIQMEVGRDLFSSPPAYANVNAIGR